MHVLVPFPDFVNGGGGRRFSSFCSRSGRRAVRRPGLRCAGVVMTGRRLLFFRFPPGGVNGHHPYRLFTRVITAGFFVPATMWDRPGSGRCGQHHD
jgi:hypothetical protein